MVPEIAWFLKNKSSNSKKRKASIKGVRGEPKFEKIGIFGQLEFEKSDQTISFRRIDR